MRRIGPHFPLSHGIPRVDDRRIVSGIIFVIRNGLRWRDAPAAYGPQKTIYNRFIRWSRLGVFNRIFSELAAKTTARVVRQHLWAHGRWPEVAFAVLANGLLVWLLFEVAELRALLSGGGASSMANTLLQLGLYVTVAFVSLLQIPPCPVAEQRLARIGRLERKLHGEGTGLWPRRARLADRHNQALADAEARIREAEEDCAERIYQYRDANARARTDAAPPWFRNGIPASLFEPLDLGQPVDPPPASIDRVTGATSG